MTAATDAIGAYHFIGSVYESPLPTIIVYLVYSKITALPVHFRQRGSSCQKSPFGLFRQAAFRIAKWTIVALFCNSAAAAGYETGKDTLTVSFPTFLPSEIFGRLPLDAENGAAVTGSSISSLLPICKTDQPCP